jgi:hypothetical protein
MRATIVPSSPLVTFHNTSDLSLTLATPPDMILGDPIVTHRWWWWCWCPTMMICPTMMMMPMADGYGRWWWWRLQIVKSA